MDKLEIIWLVSCVILFIIEAATVNLVSVWFALGCLAAFITCFFGGPLWLQIIVFLIVTILTLIATRPFAKKFINNKHEATNADMLIGKTAVVTERVDNLMAQGLVSCTGKIWSARSVDGECIEKGKKAVVCAIEGVKLMVKPLDEQTSAEE